MKKYVKNILILSMLAIFIFSTVSFATDPTGQIKTKGQTIVNAILWFGYAISLGMVVMIGIKYILGSADAKANMKGAIVNWLIGAFLVFGCTTVISWVLTATGVSDDDSLPNKIIDAAN